MRDLTKAIGSFSWAMSLFGVQQLGKLMNPGSAAAAFDAVADAAEHQLGGVLRSTFRLGDRLQRGMVDSALGMMKMDSMVPDRWAQKVGDAAGQATQAVREIVPTGARAQAPPVSAMTPRAAAGAPSAGPARMQDEIGWGPMPDAPGRSTGAPSAPGPAARPGTDGGWGPGIPLPV